MQFKLHIEACSITVFTHIFAELPLNRKERGPMLDLISRFLNYLFHAAVQNVRDLNSSGTDFIANNWARF